MFLLVSGGHFCALERDTNIASPSKALKIGVKRFSEYLAHEILHRPGSWQGFLNMYPLSFPISNFDGVTMKTTNKLARNVSVNN